MRQHDFLKTRAQQMLCCSMYVCFHVFQCAFYNVASLFLPHRVYRIVCHAHVLNQFQYYCNCV